VIGRYFVLLMFTALLAPAQEKMGKGAMMQEKSLYQRLGGYDAIAAVTDDFIGRLVTNKALVRFFGGASIDTQKRFRQHLVDQLCAATGGPCFYVGRDMKTAHGGLGITEVEWNAGVADLVASLDKFKVPVKEKDELLTIVSSTKKDIVEKP
ncbi:MAG: group I truncated hemoglobin, partial [Bacteroidota bacterium]